MENTTQEQEYDYEQEYDRAEKRYTERAEQQHENNNEPTPTEPRADLLFKQQEQNEPSMLVKPSRKGLQKKN
jgi:hypothetical protein